MLIDMRRWQMRMKRSVQVHGEEKDEDEEKE
jgi:hypothetical protein